MQLPLTQSDDAEFMLMQTRWKSILDPILKAASGDAVAVLPSGVPVPYLGGTIPDGYLLCDGRELPKNKYPDLATALGTTWGSPASAANFKLPDLRGRSLIGAGQGSGLTNRVLGTTGGEETHVLTTAEMPAHTHNSVKTMSGNTLNTTPSSGYDVMSLAGGTGLTNSGLFTGSTGGDGAHNNMQPWAAVNWIVKT